MSTKRRLVVLGMMGRTPFAGVAWQVLQYLEGFRRLGHEVYYVEDTGDWPYDPEQNTITDDCGYTVNYLARLMAWCGMQDRWAYCAAAQGGRTYGLAETEVYRLLGRADALVNLTGATVLREEHLRVPTRIYLETDPVLPQIEVAQGRRFTIELLAAHTHHFSYGENLGATDCEVPIERFEYLPTRQPVILDWWMSAALPRAALTPARFTTIASWQQSGKDIEWNDEQFYWSKHREFLKFLDLPRRTDQSLELALAFPDPAVQRQTAELLASHGWHLADAIALSMDIFPYRDYILGSRGEFTVAKDQNIRLRSGWFSDRSACYLAAGKPVITQDTGFPNILPTGHGLFGFRTAEDVIGAMEAIAADYTAHCRGAHEIAEEFFCAEKVLGTLLELAGL
jgi:hypothetical protein